MDIYDKYDEEYIQGLENFLTFEEGETVLEIAGGRGHYHSFYNKFKIGKYIAVEPNFEWLESTKSREYDCITEFNNCIYEDYYPTETIDTLICAGLMYHLPHPTHFLEVVRNRFKPKTLYLETVGAYPEKNVHDVLEAHFTPEIVNTYGQRLIWVVFHTNCTSQKKSSSNNYVISKSINILQSLKIKFLNLITFQNLNMASVITVLGYRNVK